MYTEDITIIMQSAREREMVRDLMNAWCDQGLPEYFSDDGVKFAFNTNSGNVFLVNSDCECAMLNDGKLESHYTTPYNGVEGFWTDLVEEYPTMCEEDQEYMRNIAGGRDLPELDA